LLQRGVPPRDVAKLIGDTEEVVLKHYARWVPERQERLTSCAKSWRPHPGGNWPLSEGSASEPLPLRRALLDDQWPECILN
jgi:hypothetical protein